MPEDTAISEACFLLEDDPPEQHGQPIACTQCWNALSELHRQAEAEIERLHELLADSALYVGRMASIVEGYNHPSRIHRRAMAFYDKELKPFARTIHANGADQT